MLPQLLAKDVRRALEGRISVAVADAKTRQHVRHLVAHFRRARRRGLPCIRMRGERLVLHRDQRGRVLGNIAALGHNDRHRLADEGNLLAREDGGRAALGLARCARAARQAKLGQHRSDVLERQHRRDTGDGARRGGIDAADQGVRVAAPHEGALERAGQRDVVEIAPAAGQEPRILGAQDARSYEWCHSLSFPRERVWSLAARPATAKFTGACAPAAALASHVGTDILCCDETRGLGR